MIILSPFFSTNSTEGTIIPLNWQYRKTRNEKGGEKK
jgi:hypothetical protein